VENLLMVLGYVVIGFVLLYSFLFSLGFIGRFIKRLLVGIVKFPFKVISIVLKGIWKFGKFLFRKMKGQGKGVSEQEILDENQDDFVVKEGLNLESKTLVIKVEEWQIQEWNCQMVEENMKREIEGKKGLTLEEFVMSTAGNAVFFTALVPGHFQSEEGVEDEY
jgi:hypothetical protein